MGATGSQGHPSPVRGPLERFGGSVPVVSCASDTAAEMGLTSCHRRPHSPRVIPPRPPSQVDPPFSLSQKLDLVTVGVSHVFALPLIVPSADRKDSASLYFQVCGGHCLPRVPPTCVPREGLLPRHDSLRRKRRQSSEKTRRFYGDQTSHLPNPPRFFVFQSRSCRDLTDWLSSGDSPPGALCQENHPISLQLDWSLSDIREGQHSGWSVGWQSWPGPREWV